MRLPRGVNVLVRDRAGQDLIEYALLIGFVVVASVAGINLLLDAITSLWSALNTQLSDPG